MGALKYYVTYLFNGFSNSYLIDDKNINRVKSTILSSIGIFIISIISSLSLGNLGSTINSVGG
ncbi:hypothetical protein [Helcococcus bovis]|uniref:hypothetical protein n=1 Tax=Helcococcus bovis TaxID=3153252 RepID=UPI0038BC7E03